MAYRGHVENGVVVLDEPIRFEEGAIVHVELVSATGIQGSISAARYERYRPFIGAVKDKPADWSENHDEYLRKNHAS